MATSRRKPTKSQVGPLSAEQVADLIRQLPKEEGLAPGDRIGAERELAERYGVSRWTVRQALDQLQTQGLILKTNGRSGGVFVAPGKVMRDVAELYGLPQYLQAQGMQAGTTVLGTQVVPAGDTLGPKLEVEPDDFLYQIDRLRLADGIPLSVETTWLPAQMFPGLLNESLVGSIYSLVEEKYGIVRGEAVETVTSAGAGKSQAAVLHVPQGTPLLVVDRCARTKEGALFESTLESYRGDRIAVIVHTSGETKSKRQMR